MVQILILGSALKFILKIRFLISLRKICARLNKIYKRHNSCEYIRSKIINLYQEAFDLIYSLCSYFPMLPFL